MTKDGDIIWVDDPTEGTQEASVEPSYALLDTLPPLPPGFYRRWCPKRGGWVTTQGEEGDDNQSQTNLTREKYQEWWEDALMDSIKDSWSTPGAM